MTATNPHKGDVTFNVAGKDYTLRYSHLALANLEGELDKGLIQIINELSSSQTMRIGTMIAVGTNTNKNLSHRRHRISGR